MDLSNKTICVAGIGGVGGYLGAALARAYKNVNFLARNERLAHIKEHGISIKSESLGSFTIKPHAVSDSIKDFGHLDCLFICTKNYQLEELLCQIKGAVSPDTIVVPVMNGTTAAGQIREAFRDIGQVITLDALIYIISTALPDFSIEDVSSVPIVQLGKQNANARENEAAHAVCQLLNGAGVKCSVEEDIEAAVWTKYIQNCAFNVATGYYLSDAQGIYNDEGRLAKYRCLLSESCLVARTLGIHIADDLEEKLYDRLIHRTIATGTSSLKKDMAAGRQSELETFSGALVRKAEELNIPVPVSKEFYLGMLNR